MSSDNPAKYFNDAGIPEKIRYEGPNSKNILAFKYYNAEEVILGKKMKDWLRFSVCFWHTFRGVGMDMFGFIPTIRRPWEDGTDSLENAKRRVRVAFEFFKRLGVEYYTFHDRDIAPEGRTLEETNKNLDEMVALIKQLQKESGVKLLWGTANLFSHPRYANGAATNPDVHVFAYAAAQVRKAMQITHELGGENYVFWGGREGYQSILNTNTRKELDHYAAFLKMARDYKKKIGFKGTLLIEPKPREPTKHQYDYDAQTVIGFLKEYGLDKDFKLNIEPNHSTLAGHDYEHDIEIASRYGMLGSIDANTGDPLLGWDTDQFPMDIKKATLLAQIIVRQGGLAPGGLNFDCKVRRESIDIEDMFIAHIGAMDTLARGLRNWAKIHEDGTMETLLKERYISWESDIGKKIESNECTFEELEQWVLHHGEPTTRSGKQEKFEVIFNNLI
jgi:xylose isomerase